MFAPARIDVSYTPTGEATRRLVVHRLDALLEETEETNDFPVDEREFCAADWMEVLPTGNAVKTLRLIVLRQYLSEAQLVANLRAEEIYLFTHRAGDLTIKEAFHANRPTVVSTWRATLRDYRFSAYTDPTQDNALPFNPTLDPLKGNALGRVEYEFSLTHPQLQIT